MRASRHLILLTRNGWTGAALRANESGLFAKVSAHVVKTRASDSKFCVRASKVKFRLSACPIFGVSDYRRVRLSARPIIGMSDYRRRFSTARTRR